MVSRLKNVPGIGVDRMGQLADLAADPAILRLENLDTDVPPPKEALQATLKCVEKDENNSYLPFLGQNDLRQEICKQIEKRSGQAYDWQTECIVTAGGCSGILSTLLALLEPGDEVVLPDPTYAGIINRVRIAGGAPSFVPLIPSEKGWRLDLVRLKSAISPKTKAIFMVNCSMPSGHVMNQEEWEAVCQLCKTNDTWLIYDAAMERILYDGRKIIHPSSFEGMRDRTIIIGSASKEFRMIGWRVGWVVAPTSIINDIGLVSISNVVCQVGIGMPGVTAAFRADDAAQAVAIWEGRRNTLLEELNGLPVVPPHGGWSMLLNTRKLGLCPKVASEKLLKEAKIAATPMQGWGDQAADYLRLVFSNESEERLRGVGAKIRKVLVCD